VGWFWNDVLQEIGGNHSASPQTVSSAYICIRTKQRQRYPIPGLRRLLGIQKVEAPRISRQSTHYGGKVVSPKRRPPSTPLRYPWYLFLLEDELTPGLQCGRKVKSTNNPNGPIGNRTRNLPTYSTVPQTTDERSTA